MAADLVSVDPVVGVWFPILSATGRVAQSLPVTCARVSWESSFLLGFVLVRGPLLPHNLRGPLPGPCLSPLLSPLGSRVLVVPACRNTDCVFSK